MNTIAARSFAIAGTVDPATVANSQVYTDVVDMTKFGQVVGIALLGNMAAETIDFKAYTCASDGNSKVELKACTQLAAHASNNDGTQLMINVRADDIGDARYITFGLVTGNSTGGPAAVVAIGCDARFGPASDSDLASVVQIKV